ncbi:MAG: hypothetical protein LBD40_03450 [Puniceicoccales bacterium]|nr:hypothetical protein [Puniceicoccales bacterium]
MPTYDGSGTTSNFREAINDDAWAVDWRGTLASSGESSSVTIDYEKVFEGWEGFTLSSNILGEMRDSMVNYYSANGVPAEWGEANGSLMEAFYAAAHGDLASASSILNPYVSYLLSRISEVTKVLSSNFFSRLQDPSQLNSLRNELNDATQGLTEAEKADYNACAAFYEDLPALVKNDPTNAASSTKAYMNEHLTGHEALSKGSVLAIAMLTVDLTIYRNTH